MQDLWKYKINCNEDQIIANGVSRDNPASVVENRIEVFKTHKRALKDTLGYIKVLKCHN